MTSLGPAITAVTRPLSVMHALPDEAEMFCFQVHIKAIYMPIRRDLPRQGTFLITIFVLYYSLSFLV